MTPTILQIPIPQSLLIEKRALLASHGFHFPGDCGSGSFKGVEFTYTYNGTHLTLTITKKPSLVPLSIIKSKIQEWVGITVEEKSE